jgi:hypothetical protein
MLGRRNTISSQAASQAISCSLQGKYRTSSRVTYHWHKRSGYTILGCQIRRERDRLEFFLLTGALAAALIALWQGIAAHGGIFDVPWVQFLRKPRLVGGTNAIVLDAFYLLAWVGIVTATSHGAARLTVTARPLVAAAASFCGYPIANTPGGSLFLVNVFMALYLTLGTAHTCHELATNPPKNLLMAVPVPSMNPRLAAAYWRQKGFHFLLAFVVTAVLVPFFKYFSDRRGILESGGVRLLMEKFGTGRIMENHQRACDLHRTKGDSGDYPAPPMFCEDSSPSPLSEHVKVVAIATELIRRHGFHGASSRLMQDGRALRDVKRFPVNQSATIELGTSRPCTIANACKDGAGLCVKLLKSTDSWGILEETLRVGARVVVTIEATAFEFTVARVQVGKGDLTLGLRAPDIVEQRRALLRSIRPARTSSLGVWLRDRFGADGATARR